MSTNLFSVLPYIIIEYYFNIIIYLPNKPITKIIMRKADVITKIAETTGVPKVDVLVAVEQFFKEVKLSLENGENVYVRGFGSFIVKHRAAKIGRNIKSNVSINIPAHKIPAFKPAKEFVEAVKRAR